jgi:hypothetical protein
MPPFLPPPDERIVMATSDANQKRDSDAAGHGQVNPGANGGIDENERESDRLTFGQIKEGWKVYKERAAQAKAAAAAGKF